MEIIPVNKHPFIQTCSINISLRGKKRYLTQCGITVTIYVNPILSHKARQSLKCACFLFTSNLQRDALDIGCVNRKPKSINHYSTVLHVPFRYIAISAVLCHKSQRIRFTSHPFIMLPFYSPRFFRCYPILDAF